MIDENTGNTEDAPRKRRFRFGTSFKNQVDALGQGGFSAFMLIAAAVLVMAFACLATFFIFVRGEEKQMVPNVVGKPLTTALLELQAKELYPKISLRYSDLPGDQGLVLAQEPAAGSIVKVSRRITLTVSRGVAIDAVEQYVGLSINDVQPRLQTLFSGSSLVEVAQPVYQKNEAAPGTILAQFPVAGTPIDEPVRLQLIVSSGTQQEMAAVPDLTGMTVQQVYAQMEKAHVVLDFASRDTAPGERDGTVVSVQGAGTQVPAYQHVTAEFVFPVRRAEDRVVYGILTYVLPEYPYPVPVTLTSSDTDGNVTKLVTFNHPGGQVYIPYAVRTDSVLTLSVLDSEVAHLAVQ